MKSKVIALLVSLLAAGTLLTACASGNSSGGSSPSATPSAATPSAASPSASAAGASASSATASAASKPSAAASAASKPSAAATSAASAPAASKPSQSQQSKPAAAAPAANNEMVNSEAALKKLLIGTWQTTEGGRMKFDADGTITVTSPDKTVTKGHYSIKGLEETSMTLIVSDPDGKSDSVMASFTDNNTLVIGEAVLERIFENEQVDSEAALRKLLLGKWQTPEGGTMQFRADATFTVVAPDKSVIKGTYTIKGLEETSMTITITDSDGTSSSETAVFTDNNTLVIGEAVLFRIS